ncbi:MRN complex-interacting protein isoform X2 [Choloepus didactylus]|uniref:MRN complex-interacting protein isoform X2 n=1 Tax=Choloepus didactylus TaxID=27675 RepID=UPI00189E518C|nr:MRN complex-interacting protein isoform X2 [Choloepus didactylus]
MASPQRVRVLRCCSCRLFQAHQVKKSLKWTCKACGEKQSFLRERAQPLENRWLKHLEKGSEELEPEGDVCSDRQLSPQTEEPGPPFNRDLPRKRKWGLSTVQPPGGPDARDSGTKEGSSKVTSQPHKGYASLTARGHTEGSGCLQEDTEDWRPLRPAQQVNYPPSKWAQFLPSANSSHVDTAQPRLLRMGPGPAGPGGGLPGRPPEVPRATHPPQPGPKRPCRKTSEPSQGPGASQPKGGPVVQVEERLPSVLLCDLFSTGEDFDDDL